jgi:Flp pilus assembly protein TadD
LTGWLEAKADSAFDAKKYDEAIGWYGRVLDKDPKNALAYLNRGYARQNAGDMDGARQDLKKAREIDPEVAEEEEDE